MTEYILAGVEGYHYSLPSAMFHIEQKTGFPDMLKFHTQMESYEINRVRLPVPIRKPDMSQHDAWAIGTEPTGYISYNMQERARRNNFIRNLLRAAMRNHLIAVGTTVLQELQRIVTPFGIEHTFIPQQGPITGRESLEQYYRAYYIALQSTLMFPPCLVTHLQATAIDLFSRLLNVEEILSGEKLASIIELDLCWGHLIS